MGKRLELDVDDYAFLDALRELNCQVSELHLKSKLIKDGMSESTFNAVRRRLLFARYIGSVYGNLTLERIDYRPLEAEDRDGAK